MKRRSVRIPEGCQPAGDPGIHGAMDRISQAPTRRMKDLAERSEIPMPRVVERVAELKAKVNGHLERMGFVWE